MDNANTAASPAAALLASAAAADWDGVLAALPVDMTIDQLQLLRELMLADGRTDDALRLSVLRPMSERHHAENWIAAALHAHVAGDFAQAAACAREAIRREPGSAPAQNHLARALHNLGHGEAALAAFRRSVQVDPAFSPGWHNLGVAERARGRMPEAIEAFRHAAQLRPAYRNAWLNLGKTELALDHVARAQLAFDTWLKRAPDDADALIHAGLCEHHDNHLDAALAKYEAVLARDPGNALAWLYLGVLLSQQLDGAGARKALERAAQLSPHDPEVWAELADLHEIENRLDDMATALQRGLSIAPHDPRLLLEAAIHERRRKRNETALQRLRAIDPAHLPTRFALRYHYEAGQILDQADDATAAAQAFDRANTMARHGARSLETDARGLRDRLDHIADWLERGDHASWRALPAVTDSPIFVYGFSRSGTTLLRTMLAGHPDVATLEEKSTIEACAAALEQTRSYPEAIATLSPDAADRLRTLYHERVLACAPNAAQRRIVDVMPIRAHHAALMWRLFPQARHVFVLRHPCDVVLSNWMQPFTANAANWHFHTLADTVDFYRRAMRCWDAAVAQLPFEHTVLRYEDLVDAPEPRLRELSTALQLPWNDALLRHDQRVRDGGERVTTSSYHQVAQPVYRSAMDRWRRYRDVLDPHLPALAPLIERFGYSL